MNPNKTTESRFVKTLRFLSTNIPAKSKILDLGTPNDLSERMKTEGYSVQNTTGEDLDLEPQMVSKYEVDVVTAFEIFEHLVAPFNVLRQLPASKLVASIPLRLWFAKAYRSSTDPWDRHYHEFEDWQFDWLLEKAGWIIKDREKWPSPISEIGFRPILRRFTPRYYIVYAERK